MLSCRRDSMASVQSSVMGI